MLGSYYSILFAKQGKIFSAWNAENSNKIYLQLFAFPFFRFTRINICAAESVAGHRSLMASQGKYVVVA